jgi:DNA-directed RNA polymerase subunit H (RpoH/RPB5)
MESTFPFDTEHEFKGSRYDGVPSDVNAEIDWTDHVLHLLDQIQAYCRSAAKAQKSRLQVLLALWMSPRGVKTSIPHCNPKDRLTKVNSICLRLDRLKRLEDRVAKHISAMLQHRAIGFHILRHKFEENSIFEPRQVRANQLKRIQQADVNEKEIRLAKAFMLSIARNARRLLDADQVTVLVAADPAEARKGLRE